jgi:hypothetical protein
MTGNEQSLMQSMSDEELAITGSGNDDLGFAVGQWLHKAWNYTCAVWEQAYAEGNAPGYWELIA